jgi:hypothetical protein
MSIFRRPDYHSEASEFLNQLKTAKPALERQQRDGRALLWDLRLDREVQQGFKDARVAQPAYVYQTQSDH